MALLWLWLVPPLTGLAVLAYLLSPIPSDVPKESPLVTSPPAGDQQTQPTA